MAQICIKILNKDGRILDQKEGTDEVNLLYLEEYREGDRIVLEVSETNTYYYVQLDETRGKAFVYLTGDMEYEIPFKEKRLTPLAFTGGRHIISVRKAFAEEQMNYRNLAENVWDQEGDVNCYPHASANVILAGRPLFGAQSVLDGLTFTEKHGSWPYSSWSICRREDAAWKVEFGRPVEIDKLVVYARADYPHDSWWTKMTVTFSDGSREVFELEKGGQAQYFTILKKDIEWLEISELIKGDDPSPFPALTQIQVYGRG